MEKQYSVKFFTSFVENLQSLCQDHIKYDQMVEVSGYISVEIDNAKKERYVLSELVQSTGNVISESFCTKVFKNCPLPVQRSPGQRMEPLMMSQVSPGVKRPLQPSQSSPGINRMGRSPQINRQMSPSGVLRSNNDNNHTRSSFNQRPSFNQRLNQAASYSGGRGGTPRMNSNFSGSGPGRGNMSPNVRFSSHGANSVGRPPMSGNPRMMGSQRMNQRGQRMGPMHGQRTGPQSKSPVDDPDELEVISFVPPPRRSGGEATASSMSAGTKSPQTPDPSSVTNNRPQFPASVNRSGSTSSSQLNSQGQGSSQPAPSPVSLVQNVSLPPAPQISRIQSHQTNSQLYQTSQNQDFPRTSAQQSSQSQNLSHSMPQVSQAPDHHQQMRHQGYQNSNIPQTSQTSESRPLEQPSRQHIVQQMLQGRANHMQSTSSLQHIAPSATPQQGLQPFVQPMPQPLLNQSLPKLAAPVPQTMYSNMMPNRMPLQPPHTPPGQIMTNPLQDPSRNIWTQPAHFPQSNDRNETEVLGSLNLPGLETSVDSTGPSEIRAQNASFMNSIGDRTSLSVSSSVPSATVVSSTHLPFPEGPLGSLQISNVVSLPPETLPDINRDPLKTSRETSSFGDLNTFTPSIIAEAFASLDTDIVQNAAAAMNLVTSEANSSTTGDVPSEHEPAKKQKMDEDSDQAGGPTSTVAGGNPKIMVPIGRKIKEFAAKKRAKKSRPAKADKPLSPPPPEKEPSDEEEATEFKADVTVDPPNRRLRSQGRSTVRRIYNESSDSESSLPEFGLNFESAVSTSAGLVLAGDEGDGDEGKDSGGKGSETAPAPADGSGSEKMAHSTETSDSQESPDILSEADNESYVLIELESDDEFDDEDSPSEDADSSTPVIKQELSTFTKPVQFAINRLTQFMILKKVKEPAYSIVPETLDPLLSAFYLRLRKSDGQEFIASSLKQIQNCIGTYLSTNGYPYCIKTDPKFEKSQTTLEDKLTHLRSCEDAIFTMREKDVDKLFEIGKLGTGSADSLLNTMWLMNTIHFSMRWPRDHINLKWGDVKVKRENHQEYIKHLPSGKLVWKNTKNPKRCFLSLYKKYRQMRPSSALNNEAPFYLACSDKNDCLKNTKYEGKMMVSIFRRMLTAAGLPPAMKISNLDIL